jgi:hypothetical protein
MKNLREFLSTYLPNFSKTSTLAMVDYSSSSFNSSESSRLSQGNSFNFKRFKRFFKNSPYIPFVVVGIVVVIIAVVVIGNTVSKQQASSTLGASTNSKQVAVAKPLAQEQLNKNFDFPLKDATGKTVSKIHYEIQSAELDNQIIIKGQIATVVQGREFLVLKLKITNDYDKDVQLNTRDYVRVTVDNSGDKLAAAIHNDPVDVQAISTTYTQLGFPIDANAKNIVLQVGEIDGAKQAVPLNLQ